MFLDVNKELPTADARCRWVSPRNRWCDCIVASLSLSILLLLSLSLPPSLYLPLSSARSLSVMAPSYDNLSAASSTHVVLRALVIVVAEHLREGSGGWGGKREDREIIRELIS